MDTTRPTKATHFISAERPAGRSRNGHAGVLRLYHPEREPGQRIGEEVARCPHAHRFARQAIDCARRLRPSTE